MVTILDLFCGGGMAADGYAALGWNVVGVDIKPQPHYPYDFIQDDAIEFLRYADLSEYNVIHASPPCQLFTRAGHLRTAQGGKSSSLDLLTPTLELLRGISTPWVVENVEGARAIMGPNTVRLCGSAFYLQVQRHRLFTSNIHLVGVPCNHKRFPKDPVTGKPRPWGVYHVPGDSIPKGGRTARNAEHAAAVMGVHRPLPWNTIKEGFPPAYTTYIGEQIETQLIRGVYEYNPVFE